MERTTFYKEIASNKRKSYLLMLFFIVAIIFIGYVFGVVFFGSAVLGVVIAVIISIIFSFLGFFSGDSLILQTAGAVPANKEEHAYLINTVEGVSIAAGIPTPKIYIIHDPNPNAFATGRDEKHASVAFTTGILELLNRSELEGVIAHEISHIKNYDVRFMTFVSIFAGVIVLLSDFFLRGMIFGGGGRDRDKGGVVFLLVGIILAILAPIIAHLVRLAVSRKREYLADASGARLTRHPIGLANALNKLKEYKGPDLKRASKATAHLYISSPKKKWAAAFSTHPPLEDRIKKLQSM